MLIGNGKNFPVGRVKKDVGAGDIAKLAKLASSGDTAEQAGHKPAVTSQKYQDGDCERPKTPRPRVRG